ncbi:MAG: TMEM14 family protein [bacterium]|nr:MAG: TMEM14 family protein [bacterium]
MNITVIVVGLFGLFSLAGGLIGYFKAGSIASLIAGGLSGIILFLSAYGISKGNQVSAYLALIVALLLGGRFMMTLIKSFKVMPDLLMVIFSLVTILMVGMYLFKK